MTERILILFALAALIGAGWLALRLFRAYTARKLSQAPVWLPTGPAGVLYFTTPTCVICRTRQAPALEEVARALEFAVDIRKVDALEEPDLAGRFGVLTVPTTVVIAANGHVQAINAGLAEAPALTKQLRAAVQTSQGGAAAR